jgi:hypothetical protein
MAEPLRPEEMIDIEDDFIEGPPIIFAINGVQYRFSGEPVAVVEKAQNGNCGVTISNFFL